MSILRKVARARASVTALALLCTIRSSGQTKPPVGTLPEGWHEIDQRLVFLTIELSTVESEIDATNKALKSNGYKLADANAAAEHARRGNEIMDRNGGGPVPWKDFYGQTAEAFFYHPTDDGTIHVNPRPRDQRPPQFDYIYRANLENQAKAQDDADKIGNKIDDLLAHRAALENEQSTLWSKIAFRAVASKELASHPLYRYELTITEKSEENKQQLAAIKAGVLFMRAVDSAINTAQGGVDADQKSALDNLKQATTTARAVLQESLLSLPLVANAIDDPTSPIGEFSRGAKRLADTSENMTDALRMAGTGAPEDDQLRRSNNRGQFQSTVFDYASTTMTADRSLGAAAKAWKIVPDPNAAQKPPIPNTGSATKPSESIPAKLDSARADFNSQIANAHRSLVAAIDARLDAATDAGDLAEVESLQAAKSSAARDGSIPDDCKDQAIVAAHTKMLEDIAGANAKMATAYRQTIKDYVRARRITEAQAVKEEFTASGLDVAVDSNANLSNAAATPPLAPTKTEIGTTFTPLDLPPGQTIVNLPGPVENTCVGAGGRLLLFHIKKLQQLALFDVSTGKVVKYLSLPSNDITFTAGAKKLFIGLRDLKQIQRYDLSKLELELTVPAPEGGVGELAMGAEAITPLVMIGNGSKRFWVVNPNTLTGEKYPSKNWGDEGSAWGPTNIHMSFDGSTVVAAGGGWAGIEISNIANGKVVNVDAGSYVNGPLTVAGNGALVFHVADNGAVHADLTTPLKGIDGRCFPADDPALSLALVPGGKKPELVVFSNADPKPLITLRDLPELANDNRLPLNDRVHLIPRGHMLITIGNGGDRLILRKFILSDELAAEGTDFLFVESAPVSFVERGSTYSYKMAILSKRGGIASTLQSGPKGMTLSKDGTLRWPVPVRYTDEHVPVIIQITDASGQTIFHNFSITVADRVNHR